MNHYARRSYRRAQSHHNLWVGDTIRTNYGTGPYTVEKILVDDDGCVYLTLSNATEHSAEQRSGPYYLNGYRFEDGTWRTPNGDEITILAKRPDGLQEGLFASNQETA